MSSCAEDERFPGLRAYLTDCFRCVSRAKINHYVAIFHRGNHRLGATHPRCDAEAAVPSRRGRDGFPHPPLGADEQDSKGTHQPACWSASNVLRRRAAFASLIPTSGSRTSADIIPRHSRIVLAGTGFGSMKMSLNRLKNFRCSCPASLALPSRNSLTSCTSSFGKRLEATLTTPTAPTDRNGSVKESSPLKTVKLSGARPTSSLTRSTLPLASLIATMLENFSASRITVSALISTPHRPGML